MPRADLDLAVALPLVRLALEEDLGPGDLTSRLCLPDGLMARAAVVAREEGVICGLPVAGLVFERVSEAIEYAPVFRDGDAVRCGDVVASVGGPARDLLAAERVALNFLQRLSGVATLTRRFVERLHGTSARVYDTRKTTPGWRALEKYAVRAGGGENHRMGLYDQVLVKDNHLRLLEQAARGGRPALCEAVARARAGAPRGTFVEVEAATLAEVDLALEAGADAILLDNMSESGLREAVALVAERCAGRGLARPALEASGGMTLERVRGAAEAGVDRISVGALTHSARALDIAMDVVPAET